MSARSPNKMAAEQPRLLRGPLKDHTNTVNNQDGQKEAKRLLKSGQNPQKEAKAEPTEGGAVSQSTTRPKKAIGSQIASSDRSCPSLEELMLHIDGLSKENRLLASRLNKAQALLEQGGVGEKTRIEKSTNWDDVRSTFLSKLEELLMLAPHLSISHEDHSASKLAATRMREVLMKCQSVAYDCLKTQVSLLAMQLKVQRLGPQDLEYLYSVLLRFYPDSAQIDPHKVVEVCQAVGLRLGSSVDFNKSNLATRSMGIFANSSSSVISTPSFGDSTIHCRPADGHETSEWEPFIRQSYSLWMWVMLKQGPEQTISFSDGSRLSHLGESIALNSDQARCYFQFGDSGQASTVQVSARSAPGVQGSISSDPDLRVLPPVGFRPSGKMLTTAPLFFKSSSRTQKPEQMRKQRPTTSSNPKESDASLIFNPRLQTTRLSTEMNIKEHAEVGSSRREKPVKSSLSGRSVSRENRPQSSRGAKKSVKFSERCSVLEYETELQASNSPRFDISQAESQKSAILSPKPQNQIIKAQGLIEFDRNGLSNFHGGHPFHDKENFPASSNLHAANMVLQSASNFSRKPAINLKELELNPKMYATKKSGVVLTKQGHAEHVSSVSSGAITPVAAQPLRMIDNRSGFPAGSEDIVTQQSRMLGQSKAGLANTRPVDGVHIGSKALNSSGVHSMGLIRPLVRAPTPLREEKPFSSHRSQGNNLLEHNESAVTGSEDDSVVMSKRKRAEFDGIHSGSLLKKRSTSEQELRPSRKTTGFSHDKDNVLNELRSQRMQRTSNFDHPVPEKSLLLRSVQSDTSLLGLTKGLIAKADRVTSELRSDFNKKLLDNTPLNMDDFRRSIDKTLSRNQQLMPKPTQAPDLPLGPRSARPWFGLSSISTSNLLAPDHLKHRLVMEARPLDPQTRHPTEPAHTPKPSYLHTLSSHTLTTSADLKKDVLALPTPRSDRGHPGTPNYLKSRTTARNLPHRSSLQLLGTPLLL